MPGRWAWWVLGFLVGMLAYLNRPGAEGAVVWPVFGAFVALVAGVLGLLLVLMLLLLVRPRHRSVSRTMQKARSGRVEQAIAELQREIQVRGPSPQRSAALGDCYLLTEEWRQAYIQYLDAERIDGRRGRYLAKQAFALWKMGRAEEAVPLLERASAIEPLNPSHAWTSCLVLADLGRGGEAREHLRRAELLVEKVLPLAPSRRSALEDSIAICRKRLEDLPPAAADPAHGSPSEPP